MDSNVQQPWRGRTTLIFALLAVSLGLGNVLRLPYVIGEQGGGAFLLVYVTVLALVVGPVLIAELTMGALVEVRPWGRFSGLHRLRDATRVGAGLVHFRQCWPS